MTARDLSWFVAKRLMAMVVLMVIVSFLVFSLVYLAPGSAIDAYLGTRPRTPELVAALNQKYHLDEPFLVQYWLWLQNAVHFDFGTSVQSTLPVTQEIGSRLGGSIFLAAFAYVLAIFLGVVPGIIAALHKQRILDRGLVTSAVIALSTPPFVTGIFLLYLFAILIPVFPVSGRGVGFGDQVWHLALPALALALSIAAFLLRHTRSAVIGVLEQDYVTFARARGIESGRIITRYALRNALIPIVTVSGALLAYFVTGAVLVETTFSLNGLGSLLVSAAQSKDLPVLQGLSLLIALLIVGANLLADIAYVAIDPRVRLGRKR